MWHPGHRCPPGVPNPPPGATAAGPAASSPDTRVHPAAVIAAPTAQAPAPVRWFKVFQPADGGFSVEYPDSATVGANGASWKSDTDQAQLFGVAANNLTPQEIAERFRAANFPNATVGYVIPNARVGYESGYGELDNVDPQSASGPYAPQRVLIMVAVKNGLALVAEASGPLFAPKNYHGHGTGAELAIVDDAYSYFGFFVNTFSWKGDPPR